eukprot:9378167-Pyramimonas_sp.AAC.1
MQHAPQLGVKTGAAPRQRSGPPGPSRCPSGASALDGMLPRQPGSQAPPRQLGNAADPGHRPR